MKSFFRRLFGKAKRRPPAAGPPPAAAAPESKAPEQKAKPKKNTGSSFEPLEGRIAPAVLLNPATFQYTDIDGDLVTVKFSKKLFTQTGTALEALLNSVFVFKGGTASVDGELAQINLTALPVFTSLHGLGVTITATKQGTLGNDLANVGHIKAATSNATGLSLGAIVVDGDLGQIDAGDATRATGISSLTVQSLGAVGLASQNAGGSLESNVVGAVGKLVVKGEMVDAVLKVVNGIPGRDGNIGSITIGESLRVSDGNTASDVGQILASGNIGTVKVGTLSTHGIFGGQGNNTGLIKASGKIGAVTIAGDLRGGQGKDSGEINALEGIKSVTILGNLWAGGGENSGRIATNGNLGAVKLATLHGEAAFPRIVPDGDDPDGDPDTVIDPAGKNAGTIFAAGNLASFTAVAVHGGAGEGSGSVKAGGKISKVNITAKLTGGDGKESGRIHAGTLGTVVVGQSLAGGIGVSSGSISATGNISGISVNTGLLAPAALVAGVGSTSGAIDAGGNIGTVKIGGLIDGSTVNTGISAASIHAGGGLSSVTITGTLKGGVKDSTGSIAADFNIGKIKITGDLQGGGGSLSGSVLAGGKVSSATIQGSLKGGAGENSGSLMIGLDSDIAGDLTKAVITGLIQGGAGVGSGSVNTGGKLGSLTVGAASAVPANVLIGGTQGGSGSIFAGNGIGSLVLNGNVQGGSEIHTGAIISTGAISKLRITGALNGGTGEGSGSVQAFDIDLFTSFRPGDLGSLTIGGAVSGRIAAEGSAKSITIGALAAGGSLTVGSGLAAFVDDYQKIGAAAAITIKGAVTGVIDVAARLGSLTIEGAVTNSSILVGRDLGKFKVNSSIDGLELSAQGQAKPSAKADLAIGSVTVAGSVSNSSFLAGYDRFGNPLNSHAQIGTVTVNGNWTASTLAAGVVDVAGDGFGNGDDTLIDATAGPVAKIAAVVIKGDVTGTAAGGDHFGFVAEQIAKVQIKGMVQNLTPGLDTIPLAGDTSIREIARPAAI